MYDYKGKAHDHHQRLYNVYYIEKEEEMWGVFNCSWCWASGLVSKLQSSSSKSFICVSSQGTNVLGHIPSCSRSLSLSVPLSELYSHLITFQQRHAALFIAEWCFFIRLCLFVVHWSTEGFLPADVSSAGLQRDGWDVGEERKKRGRQTEIEWYKRG